MLSDKYDTLTQARARDNCNERISQDKENTEDTLRALEHNFFRYLQDLDNESPTDNAEFTMYLNKAREETGADPLAYWMKNKYHFPIMAYSRSDTCLSLHQVVVLKGYFHKLEL